MADGAQRTAWAHTAALILGHLKIMTGQGPRLIDLIPERYRVDASEELSPEDEEANTALAFAELESGLRALSRQAGSTIAGFAR
jgi:hypothetical protein